MDTEKEYLSVGEIALRSGLAVSAIHFYDSKGLLRSHRNKGNQRRYHRRELRILGYIKVGQRIGLTLEEIREAFSDIENKEEVKIKDWIKLGKKWDQLLKERLELIENMRNQLSACIGCGCLSLKDCPLRNPNDELFKEGPGPRLVLKG